MKGTSKERLPDERVLKRKDPRKKDCRMKCLKTKKEPRQKSLPDERVLLEKGASKERLPDGLRMGAGCRGVLERRRIAIEKHVPVQPRHHRDLAAQVRVPRH